MHVNLLPRRIILRGLLLRRVRRWGAIWSLCAFAVLAMCLVRYSALSNQRERLVSLELQAMPARKVHESLASLQSEIAAVNHTVQQLERLKPDQKALAVLSVVSQSAASCAGKVRLGGLNFTDGPRGVKDSHGMLVLRGVATGDANVAMLVDQLRNHNVFRSVDLKSLTADVVSLDNDRTFEIVCSF